MRNPFAKPKTVAAAVSGIFKAVKDLDTVVSMLETRIDDRSKNIVNLQDAQATDLNEVVTARNVRAKLQDLLS